MAIRIKSASGTGITGGVGSLSPVVQEVIIVADTEAEITALGSVVDDGSVKVIPTAGSTAVTAADGAAVVYVLLPGGWQKAG